MAQFLIRGILIHRNGMKPSKDGNIDSLTGTPSAIHLQALALTEFDPRCY